MWGTRGKVQQTCNSIILSFRITPSPLSCIILQMLLDSHVFLLYRRMLVRGCEEDYIQD